MENIAAVIEERNSEKRGENSGLYRVHTRHHGTEARRRGAREDCDQYKRRLRI